MEHNGCSQDPEPVLPCGSEAARGPGEAPREPLGGAPQSVLLTGTVRRRIFELAMPALGEQVLNTMVGLVDVYLAGYVGRDATSAVGLASYVSWLIWMLFGAVGVGAAAVVARAIGSGNRTEARAAVSQALGLALILGAAAVAAVVGAAPLIAMLLWRGTGPEALTVTYLRIEGWGHLLLSLTAIGGACMRAAGDTRTPMRITGVVNVINIVISCSLVFGWFGLPALDVVGIAIGTVAARSLGGLLMLAALSSPRAALRLDRRKIRPQWVWTARLLRIGLPASAEGAALWGGNFLFMMIVARTAGKFTGGVNFAAHIIGMRVESLSYLPAAAWSMAGGAVVGQCLGAGMPRRAKQAGYEACLQGGALITLMGVLYFLAAHPLYRLFTGDPDVMAAGVPALRLVAFFQPCLAVLIILNGCLRGAGDTRVPFAITTTSIMAIRVPIAYLGGIRLDYGLVGAWIGMCVDMSARAILYGLRFAGGRWQRVKV